MSTTSFQRGLEDRTRFDSASVVAAAGVAPAGAPQQPTQRRPLPRLRQLPTRPLLCRRSLCRRALDARACISGASSDSIWCLRPEERNLDRMISWLAAFAAVVLAAATTLASSAHGAAGDVRIEVLSVTPRSPRAAQPFELVARVEFAPAPGSIRCNVWIGGRRFRNIRLVWDNPTARCYFRLPAGARGKRLTIGLAATLGGSLTRTTLAFRVS